jgi:hypothetical protein
MDVLDQELLRFWESLNKNDVHYLMVGGFATRFHGYNRNTDDWMCGWKIICKTG